jgi:mono/diheme cytochrome c family protein
VWRDHTSPRRVYHAIREGVPGTAMASWKVLNQDETWDLVAYLLTVAEKPSAKTPTAGSGTGTPKGETGTG